MRGKFTFARARELPDANAATPPRPLASGLSVLGRKRPSTYGYSSRPGQKRETGGEQMNAFQLLKEDHQKVSGLFQQLEPTTERAEKTRTELFAKLKEELDIHAKIEESIFYPSIKQAAETREIVLEGFEEHHVIKMLLKELEAVPVDTEQWTAKLKVLQENVEHHVEEEEGEMFQKARQVLSEDEINQLGARMEEMKLQLKQQTKSAGA